MKILSQLRSVVGEAYVLDGSSDLSAYQNDWTGRWQGNARAVVMPASTEEIQEVIQLCSRSGVNVVPQGGNSGLVGGAVPYGNSVVLSTKRLTTLGLPDAQEALIVAEAGVLLSSVETAARSVGYRYGVDFAARDTATVGGSIATNAGGHHVVRYGMTQHQLLGVEAVLGNGQVISHLRGLPKDNTGYNLASLLCGSEGTLGIITKATLRLHPAMPHVTTALVAFETLAHALSAVMRLRHQSSDVEALELMFRPGIEAVSEKFDLEWPLLSAEVVLLIEAASSQNTFVDLFEVVSDLPGVVDSAVATESTRRETLWRWRDLHTEAILRSSQTPPHKLDVTLPLGAIEPFFKEINQLVGAQPEDVQLWLFGHLGDGNLHVNVTGLSPTDETVDAAVLKLVAQHHGSISAEHGIGRAKSKYLALSRSPSEIEAFRAIKAALDPNTILNPGVLLPD